MNMDSHPLIRVPRMTSAEAIGRRRSHSHISRHISDPPHLMGVDNIQHTIKKNFTALH